jgi:hypothetical protein
MKVGEVHTLNMSENRILKKIFGHKGGDVREY